MLPEGVEESKINERFQDGVLEVRVEGAAAVQEPKKIQIEAASDEEPADVQSDGEASGNGSTGS